MTKESNWSREVKLILGLFQRDVERGRGGRTVGRTLSGEEALTAIRKLTVELVGEDATQKGNDFTTEASYQKTQKYLDAENRLRHELLKALEED